MSWWNPIDNIQNFYRSVAGGTSAYGGADTRDIAQESTNQAFNVTPRPAVTAPAQTSQPTQSSTNQPAQSSTSQGVLGVSTRNSTGQGGSGALQPSYNPADMFLLDQQIQSARDALGRVSNQRGIGLSNIESTFGNATTNLANDRARSERDYNTQATLSRQDFTDTRSDIRRGAGQQLSALQRLLGAAGSGRSSAAQLLSPFAVNRESAQRFGEVEDTFGRNADALDTSFADTTARFDAEGRRLEDERKNQIAALNSGLASNEVNLNDTLAQLELEKQRLQGGGIDSIRNTLTPYQSRIQQLLGQIDELGRLSVSPARRINYTPANLDQYNFSRFDTPTLNERGEATGDYISPFVSLLRDREERLA